MKKESDEERATALVHKLELVFIFPYGAGCGNPECPVCNGYRQEAKELILSFAEEIRKEDHETP